MDAPIRNNTEQGTITTLVAGILSLLAYVLRAVARLPWFGGNWGLDDWVMTAAIVCLIAGFHLRHTSKLTLHRYSLFRLQYAHTCVSSIKSRGYSLSN
jgi:hypothetical protein